MLCGIALAKSSRMKVSITPSKGRWRRTVLLSVLLLEIVFLMGANNPSPSRATRAFLTKQQDHFLLAWKDEFGAVDIVKMDSLNDTLAYAYQELGLQLGRNFDPRASIENVWMDHRSGTYVVLWKADSEDLLNQISFFNQSEAQFFARAFRSGAYSRSIVGHSVLLTAISLSPATDH